MLVAIAAIAVLQTLVILFVVGLLFESQANTFLVRRSEARRRHYEPHVLGLLLNPSDIGELQRAVPLGTAGWSETSCCSNPSN